MSFVDMKLPKEKESKSGSKCEPIEPDKPKYPYGLSITLEKDALSKLGLAVSDFDMGEEITISAQCVITSLRQSEDRYGDDMSVGLQITKLDMGNVSFNKAYSKATKE